MTIRKTGLLIFVIAFLVLSANIGYSQEIMLDKMEKFGDLI